MYIELTINEMRDIIFGRVQYRKCPACDNNGEIHYDGATGDGANPFPIPNCEYPETETCSECDGLAYVPFRVN